MPIVRLYEQPEILKGHEYGPGVYEWFVFRTEDGEEYAHVGLCFDHPQEAWMYWRILKPSLEAWKDLKRVVCPELRRYCKSRGKSFVVVRTSDDADVNFDKMVGFMGFDKRRVVKTAWQEL